MVTSQLFDFGLTKISLTGLVLKKRYTCITGKFPPGSKPRKVVGIDDQVNSNGLTYTFDIGDQAERTVFLS